MTLFRTACMVVLLQLAAGAISVAAPKGGPGLLDGLLKNTTKAIKRGGKDDGGKDADPPSSAAPLIRNPAAGNAPRQEGPAGAAGMPVLQAPAAQAEAPEPPAPRKVYGADTLTPTQIEACIASAGTLDREGERVDAEAAGLQEAAQSITAEDAQLDGERERLQRGDARVEQANDASRRYRTALEGLKAEETALADAIAQFNAQCTAKQHYAEDMEAVKQRLGLSEP
jgi:hypothetical protein